MIMKITKKTLHTLFFLAVIIALVWCVVRIYGNEKESAPDLFDEVLIKHAQQTACISAGGTFISYKLDGFEKTICEIVGEPIDN